MTMIGLAIDIIIIEPVHKLINLTTSLDSKIIDITKIGAIFCHLIITYNPIVFKEVRMLGNQKWRGAAPNFIMIPRMINMAKDVLDSDIMALLKIMIEPTLWIMKYIIAGFLLLSSFIRLGTNLIRFSSSASQISGHELMERTAKEPRITPVIITLTKIKFVACN